MKKTIAIVVLLVAFALMVNVLAQSPLSPSDVETSLAQRKPHPSGTVRYPDGTPAAGVQVMFYPGSTYSDDDYNYHEVITDKKGRYEIPPPKKVSMFVVGWDVTNGVVMARDVEKNMAAVQSFFLQTTNVDMTLGPAITLSGLIKNTEGAAVGGAEISLGFFPTNSRYAPEMQSPFKADDQGRFSIPTLPQGVDYWTYSVRAEGYDPNEWNHETVKAEATQTNYYEFPAIVLRRVGATFTGKIGFDRTITIPDTTNGLPVTKIGAKALMNYYLLTNVTIGANVYHIGAEAFRGCTSLGSITIPAGVGRIDGGAFNQCTNLTAITVDGGNTAFSSLDGVLFNKSKTVLIHFPALKGGSYAVPDSVTSIENSAFSDCHDLTDVKIPDSVINIGYGAFSSCTSLTNVTIGDGVTAIPNGMFNGCHKLVDVRVGNHVKGIQSIAFAGCPLSSITLPDSVIYVERMAFYAPGAAHVMIGRGTTNIEPEAFIGEAFKSITVSTDNPAYSSMDGVLFDKNKSRIVSYPCDKSGNYTIPDGVKSIGKGSFYTCGRLTSVTIPDSVTNIEEQAFLGCSSLTNITIGKYVNNIGKSAFDGCQRVTQIYFHGNAPDIGERAFLGDRRATIYYLPTSTGWTNTFGGRPTMMMQ